MPNFQYSFDEFLKERKSYIRKIKVLKVEEAINEDNIFISCPEDVFRLKFLQDEFSKADREKFICLHLNIKNKLISYETVAIGSLNSCIVHPREVFKGAILSNAASVLVCHNHPSGDPEPSEEDIKISKRLEKASELLGIPLLDHIIFGENSFTSLKERGLL